MSRNPSRSSLSRSFFDEPPISDVEFQSSKPRQLPFGITIGLAQTLYPRHGPIGSHNAERVVPVVPRPPLQNLVEKAEQRVAVILVNTGKPCVERRQFFRGEAI